MKNPLQELLDLYPNINQAAIQLKLGRPNIYHWRNLGFIPHCRGLFIEQATGGKIKASDIWQYAGTFGKSKNVR